MAVTESGLEAFAFSARRVEKPWGYELIWAHSEHYLREAPVHPCGRAAEPPVPQPEGRDDLRPPGPDRDRAWRRRRSGDRGGRCGVPDSAAERCIAGARSRTRSCSRRRRPSSTTSCGSKTATAAPARDTRFTDQAYLKDEQYRDDVEPARAHRASPPLLDQSRTMASLGLRPARPSRRGAQILEVGCGPGGCG